MWKIGKMPFNRRKLAGNVQMDRRLMFMKKNAAQEIRSYIHLYFHNIQTVSSLKSHGKPKPNFVFSILRKGEQVYINGLDHLTEMTSMAINNKNFLKNLLLQNQKVYDFETIEEWCGIVSLTFHQ